MRTKVMEIMPDVALYRDDKTGIAMVEDGRNGNNCTLHPNIDSSGSVDGMVNQGYWSRADKTVQAMGAIHNISVYVPEADPQINAALHEHCQCGGNHGSENKK